MPRTCTLTERATIAGDVNHYLYLEVASPDGVFTDTSALGALAIDMTDGATWGQTLDQAVATGTLTLRRDTTSDTLAPLMGASSINRTAAGAYAPFLEKGRACRIFTATVPAGVAPTLADKKPMFSGMLRNVKSDANPVTVQISDLAAWISDAWIRDAATYASTTTTPGAGLLLDAVIQAMLNDTVNAPIMGGPVTLYVPTTPAWQPVGPAPQQPGSLLQACRDLAQEIGWELRYRYDASDVLRLTLYEPDRANTTADWVIGPSEYTNVTNLQTDIKNIRNVIRVKYVDAAGLSQSVTVTDAASVTKYGPRFMQVVSTTIRTSTDATTLANAMLSDLSEADADQEITMPYFWPVQLGDLITFQANGVHYDSDQTLAVVGFTHTFAPGSGEGVTTLQVRGKVAGAYKKWLRRGNTAISDTPGGPQAIDPITGRPVRAVAYAEGGFALVATDTGGFDMHTNIVDSRSSPVNTHFRYGVDGTAGVVESGTEAFVHPGYTDTSRRPTVLRDPVLAGDVAANDVNVGQSRARGGFTNATGGLASTAADSRASLVNTHGRANVDLLDVWVDSSSFKKPTPVQVGFADRAGLGLDSAGSVQTGLLDAATIGGLGAATVSKMGSRLFSEAWDNDFGVNWVQVAGAGTIAYLTAAAAGGIQGSRVAQFTDTVEANTKIRIPINPNKLYKLVCRYRQVGVGSSNAPYTYLGFTGFLGDGTVANNNGGNIYCLAAGLPLPAGGYVEYVSWVGKGATQAFTNPSALASQDSGTVDAPQPFNVGTTTIAPLFLANYPGAGATAGAVSELDYWQMWEFDEDGTSRLYATLDGGANVGRLTSGAKDSRASLVNTHGRLSVDTLDGWLDSSTRFAVVAVDVNKRPIIDLSQSHVNTLAASKVSGSFASTVDATGYTIGGVTVINHGGSYTELFDVGGRIAIYLGGSGDPGNYYDNDSHNFRSRASVPITTLNSGGFSGLPGINGWGIPSTTPGTNTGLTWPSQVGVKTDGVMEVGRYIDFHVTSNDGVDFAFRMHCDASGVLTLDGSLSVASGVAVGGSVTVGGTLTMETPGDRAIDAYGNPLVAVKVSTVAPTSSDLAEEGTLWLVIP